MGSSLEGGTIGVFYSEELALWDVEDFQVSGLLARVGGAHKISGV